MPGKNPKPPDDSKKKQPGKVKKWLTPRKPEYMKLEIGEELTGLYLGRQYSQYGPVYRFQVGEKIMALNGGRVQLDNLMDEADAAGWKGKTLCIQRQNDAESNAGRPVQQYRIGLLDGDIPF